MTHYSLNEKIAVRENNLNTVELMAALLVIVSHAYAFATGYLRTDWLYIVSGGSGDFGALAVNVFFFYSGLMITGSLFRNGDTKRYFKRRVARIFPAFILVTLLIVFIAGPVITSLSPSEYFRNADTYGYLKNLLLLTEHTLPGVFTHNIYGNAVNGPIWTIRVEVACYIMCFIYYKAGLLKKNRMILSVISYMLLSGIIGYFSFNIGGMQALILPVTMFYLGMVYRVYAEDIRLNKRVAVFSALGLCIFMLLHQFIFACMVFLPYLLCYLAFATDRKNLYLDKLGEYSYETYLWGGFIGQLVTFMFGGSMSEYINMLITIPVSLLLGYLTAKAVSTKQHAGKI